MNPADRPYRDGVLGVIVRADGCVLVFERSDVKGQFQFPQGGIDAGEDTEACLKREVFEETGCDQVRILAKGDKAISYDFPHSLGSKITKKYRGQSQWWFKLELVGDCAPDLDAATDDEFVSFKWCRPADAIAGIAPWRKPSYVAGLTQLGLWPEQGGESSTAG